MTRLPRISGRECVSALLKLGFRVKRQHGSHNPELASLPQKLQDYVSATQTVLVFRRDDLGYRLNKIDLAAVRYDEPPADATSRCGRHAARNRFSTASVSEYTLASRPGIEF